jgi:hypothetical protein
MIWTPPIVGKETNTKMIEENWRICCQLTLERFADLVFDELQLNNSNPVSFLFFDTDKNSI